MPNSRVAKFTGWSIIIAAIVAGAIGIYSYANYAKFHRRVAEIKAAGDPVSLASFERVVVNEQDDMLFHLLPLRDSLHEFAEQIPKYDLQTRDNLTDAEAIEKFEAAAALHPTLLDTLTRTSKLPEKSFDPYDLPEFKIMDWQKVMLILDWKARVQNAKGETDEAVETCLEMLRFADVVERPMLLNYLLGQAFRIMACNTLHEAVSNGEIAPDLMVRLKQTLDSIDSLEVYREAIKMERAFLIEGLINQGTNEDENPLASPSGLTRVALRLPGGPASFFGNDILDQFEEIIKRSEAPLSAQIDSPGQISSPSWFGNDFVGNYDSFRSGVGKSKALARAVRIEIALNQAELNAEKTEWSQADLVDLGLPIDVTVDPFTGKAMIVRRSEFGWSIYSLGPNQTDEKNPHEGEDVGFGPRVEVLKSGDNGE